jgi:ankyrin repeat protein
MPYQFCSPLETNMLPLFRALVVAVSLVTTSAHADSLFDAAERGDLESVETLLQQGHDVDELGRNAETPLMAAALAGEVAIAELLIARGADVMARNEGGLTPLHAAAYSGSAEVALLLLDHGAALEDRNNISGTTPFFGRRGESCRSR